MPARATLPGVLDALGVAAADAHTQQHCYDETRYVTFGGKTATYTHTTCVNIEHSHWYRSLHMGIALGAGCAALGFAAGGPATAMAVGMACGAAGSTLGNLPRSR
ncbi:hypothetical protein [Candidatus Poriferisodalis sp.]|uniref:hypothetical protein n=1 Tax=Candidatus Poriferisodalis sp. TaxID=3101277 RepID=UPI003B01B489